MQTNSPSLTDLSLPSVGQSPCLHGFALSFDLPTYAFYLTTTRYYGRFVNAGGTCSRISKGHITSLAHPTAL